MTFAWRFFSSLFPKQAEKHTLQRLQEKNPVCNEEPGTWIPCIKAIKSLYPKTLSLSFPVNTRLHNLVYFTFIFPICLIEVKKKLAYSWSLILNSQLKSVGVSSFPCLGVRSSPCKSSSLFFSFFSLAF